METQLNNFMKQQMVTMGLVNNNNNGLTIILGIVIMQIVEFIAKYIPIIMAYVVAKFNEYTDTKINEITEIAVKKTNKSFITFVYNKDKSDIIVESLMNFISGKNSALRLKFSGIYIVENKNEFILEDNILCSIKNSSFDDDNTLKSTNICIYSEHIHLSELKDWVRKITDNYVRNKDSKMGNGLYYFNAITTDIKKTNGYVMDTRQRYIFAMTPFETNKSLKNLFGPEIGIIQTRINKFINNKKWYELNGVPYTLGILMYGVPGTGKTSTIKAIAKDTKRHIINVRLTETTTKSQLRNLFFNSNIEVLNNNQSVETFNIPLDKRIYVFEEIDCMGNVVRDRNLEPLETDPKNKIPEDAIDLGFLLEMFDGVLETPGRIMIATTNHPEVIDPALLRPGRMDLNVKFGYLGPEALGDMFHHFFGIRKYFENIPQLTPARASCIIIENSDNPDECYSRLTEFVA